MVVKIGNVRKSPSYCPSNQPHRPTMIPSEDQKSGRRFTYELSINPPDLTPGTMPSRIVSSPFAYRHFQDTSKGILYPSSIKLLVIVRKEQEHERRFPFQLRLDWRLFIARSDNIRKLGEFLSCNMNTQNALWIVVGVMNRLAYFRSNHNARSC